MIIQDVEVEQRPAMQPASSSDLYYVERKVKRGTDLDQSFRGKVFAFPTSHIADY